MTEKLTKETVIALKRKGWTNTQIAEPHGVTSQYVYNLAIEAGYIPPQRVVEENLPWHVPQKFRASNIYRRLVWFLKMQLEFGIVGEKSREDVDDMIKFMRDTGTVIDFNPEYDSPKVFTHKPGFKFVPRDEEDHEAGNYIIKIRPGVRIEGLGKQLWRMPST